jgi:hypothetical protein
MHHVLAGEQPDGTFSGHIRAPAPSTPEREFHVAMGLGEVAELGTQRLQVPQAQRMALPPSFSDQPGPFIK